MEQLSKLKAKRLGVYHNMPDPLKEVARELCGMAAEHAQHSLISAWDIGARVHRVWRDQARYGCRGLEQLATCLATNVNRLYELREIALRFTREQVEQLAARRTEAGGHLNLSHLLLLARVRSDADLAFLTEQAYVKALTPRALAELIDRGDEQ